MSSQILLTLSDRTAFWYKRKFSFLLLPGSWPVSSNLCSSMSLKIWCEGRWKGNQNFCRLLQFSTLHISPKPIKHRVVHLFNWGGRQNGQVTRKCRKKNKIYISKHYLTINISQIYLKIRKNIINTAGIWIENLQNKK